MPRSEADAIVVHVLETAMCASYYMPTVLKSIIMPILSYFTGGYCH